VLHPEGPDLENQASPKAPSVRKSSFSSFRAVADEKLKVSTCMSTTAIREPTPSEALSTAMVGIFKEYLGRGPTKARVQISSDNVIGFFSDTLTKAERSLVEKGEGDAVRLMRRKFQDTMRDDFVAAVEAQTGREVIAFMSDNHLDPDIAVEVFVLRS
jgi:uncharacterized protein YbcI